VKREGRKMIMKEWQELGKKLRRYINTETFPLAVRMILKDRKVLVRWQKSLRG